MPKAYLYLIAAVLMESLGSASLQASQQFTRVVPTLGVIVGFGTAFYLMTLTLQYMPLGVVYALWSGMGIILIALIGWVVFGQPIDFWGMVGMGLIVAGIAVLNLLSRTAMH